MPVAGLDGENTDVRRSVLTAPLARPQLPKGAGRRVSVESTTAHHCDRVELLSAALNRPSDVVVKSDGAIYFSDPNTGNAAPDQTDLTYAGVYRVSPDLGTIILFANDFIALSSGKKARPLGEN
jgi:glucose/arabinose dehydrogenase